MNASVYTINRGINKAIEFKGLKAQYIWYLGGGIICLLIVYAIMYICGINAFICLGIVFSAGGWWVFYVYRMSAKYGEHGMAKKIAKRNIPKLIRCNNRKIFIQNLG
ncbi:MAG: DUF4133 domain-containing protein [Bacteroidetes bacterium]|nr:DUF4133 domain-containing protein [Bacteroidota bacterium]